MQDGCVFLDLLTPPYSYGFVLHVLQYCAGNTKHEHIMPIVTIHSLSLSNFFSPDRKCTYYKVLSEDNPSSKEEKTIRLTTDQPYVKMAAGRLFVEW